MAVARRVGSESSKTRAQLLDLTVQIMLEQGYAAVTSRGLALRLGVQPPLVHYYFPTLDDLFIAAFKRGAERNLERLREALSGENPLQGLWNYANERTGIALTFEFLALSNHRKALKTEMAKSFEQFRDLELAALTEAMTAAGVDLDEYPPDGVLPMLIGLPASVVQQEQLLGVHAGHANALRLIERYLSDVTNTDLETPSKRSPSAKKSATTRA